MSTPLNTAAIKILLVEDSPSDADVLRQTLYRTGAGRFEFTWVERLDDALTRLSEEAFDVLLLDLSLPDSSGPDTFRRAHMAAPGVPIVVLTGVLDESLGLAAVHEGIQDYLVKGQTDGRQIARAIRYAVERTQAEEQLRRLAQFPEENPNPVLRVATDGSLLYANAPARTWLASMGWAAHQTLPAVVRGLAAYACDSRRPVDAEVGDFPARILWLAATHPAGENYVNIYGRDVTERKHAEEELRRNQEWLKVTLTSISDGVIASNTAGRITFVNPVAASLTGWAPEEALGQPMRSVLNIINEDTREPAEDLVERVLKERRAILLANHSALLTRDGRQIGIEDSAAPILDGAGNVTGVVLVFREVTEKRRAQEALVRAKREWERTFDSVPDLIAILDNHHRILRANRAMAQLLGVTPGQCVGQQCFSCVHGSNQPPAFCPHTLTISDGKQHIVEVHEDKLGGEFLVSTTPLRDEHGRMVGSVHVARDITERKQAEERIRHQNAVLEGINRILREALTCDTEEQLGRACLTVAEEVTQSDFGILAEVKADGRLVDIAISDPGWEACRMKNDGKPELSGGLKIHGLYGRVLLDGKSFFTNDPQSHPDSAGIPEGHPTLKAFLGVPLEHEGKTTGIIAVANREGGYRPQDLGALEALALVIVQVLMRKRAEQAVRAGEERLRHSQKMESIGVLAGGIAHDFNNLLTAIMGNASLLQDEVREESRDVLAAIIHASEKAADLTRQMLAYAGKGRFYIEPLDLARIASDVTDLLRASLPKKVDLKLAVAPDLPAIEADRGQVQQIVMNLVINGAESIGADQTGTVTITTKAVTVSEADRICNETTGESVAPGEYVCLEVDDTGCGMDKETRARIFDPFFTTKFVGRGLGLAAVAGIVQAQRGAIQVQSEPGKGTTFRVFLPAVEAPDAPRRTGPTADLRGKGLVLLVDDESAVRDFARAALERQGYNVLSASDGEEAVRTFEENAEHVNLVLLDLTMPVMGGDEAIGLLKSRRADVKMIVMSGYGESEARRMFAGKGASGFLQKPFTAAKLAGEVKAALAHAPEKRSELAVARGSVRGTEPSA